MSPLPLPREGIETNIVEIFLGTQPSSGLLYHFPERGLKRLIAPELLSPKESPLPLPREGIETINNQKILTFNGVISPLPLPREGIETICVKTLLTSI